MSGFQLYITVPSYLLSQRLVDLVIEIPPLKKWPSLFIYVLGLFCLLFHFLIFLFVIQEAWRQIAFLLDCQLQGGSVHDWKTPLEYLRLAGCGAVIG